MAAISKDELIAVFEKDYAKLCKTLEGVAEAEALTPHPEDGLTIKDTLAHRTHWSGLFFTWYGGEKRGETVQTPAPGYKWNQLKAYNAKVREEWSPRSWEDVTAAFHAAHAKLLAFVKTAPEDELYTKDVYVWTNNWTLGRWAEASGPSHYRSANKYIRQIVRKIR